MDGEILIHSFRQPPFLLVIYFNLASNEVRRSVHEVRRSEHEVMGLWFASYYKKKCKFTLCTLFTLDWHSLLTSLYLKALVQYSSIIIPGIPPFQEFLLPLFVQYSM
jgi:hypothetical protein